jgi:cyclic pyranopterin phosphate synthase
MVDVGEKPESLRTATARGSIRMAPSAYTRAREGNLPKGDLISTARIAGIQGAKQTPHLIPLCHPIQLDAISLDFEWEDETCTVHVMAASRARAATGVEMEALTACAVACLTLYDMVKGLDKGATIGPLMLLAKAGGKSGTYRRST